MQLSVQDAMDAIEAAFDNTNLGDPMSQLTPQQVEQIASICIGKTVTIDPADLAQVQADWLAQNAAPSPQSPAPAVTASHDDEEEGDHSAAPPEPRGPAFNPSAGRKSAFEEELDKLLSGS
jgi:hypothetical protein